MKKGSWFWGLILVLHAFIIVAPFILAEPGSGTPYMLRPATWIRTSFLAVGLFPLYGLAFSRRVLQPQYWGALLGVELAAFFAAIALKGLGLSNSWGPVAGYLGAVLFTAQLTVFYGHYLYAFKSRHIWG
jgi:hypothetical protein